MCASLSHSTNKSPERSFLTLFGSPAMPFKVLQITNGERDEIGLSFSRDVMTRKRGIVTLGEEDGIDTLGEDCKWLWLVCSSDSESEDGLERLFLFFGLVMMEVIYNSSPVLSTRLGAQQGNT